MNRSAWHVFSGRSAHPAPHRLALGMLIAVCCALLLGAPTAGAAPLADATIWEMTQPGPSEWVQNPVEVVVEAEDNDLLSVPNPEYRVTTNNGVDWSSWITDTLVMHQPDSENLTLTVTLSSLVDSGTDNKVQFRVTDDAHNREYSDELLILVDESAPTPPQDLAASPSSWTNVDSYDLSWTNPSGGSDMARAYFKLDGAPVDAADADGWQEGASISTLAGLSVSTVGQHTFYVWLEDSAGYSDYTQYATVDVWLDQDTPASPSGISVTPDMWTSTNAFNVSWTNPTQTLAPIARALFKFDTAPTSAGDSDGSQSGENIQALVDIAAPVGGAIPCYVWLEDSAGNADHTTAQVVTLYYSGGIAPSAPFAMTIAPSDWTQTNSFDVSWSNPSTPSGIGAAWYKWSTAPAHSSDGTRVEGVDITQLDDLTAPSQGQHPLFVWLEDGAGARDENNASQRSAHWDITPPSTAPDYDPPLPGTGWFGAAHGDVTVSLAATDAHAGVQDTLFRSEGGLFTSGTAFVASDTSSWQFYSVDNAGNTEPVQTLSVPIDREPPVSSVHLTPESAAGGWYSQTVTLEIIATDPLSGPDTSYYRLDGGPLQSGTQIVVSESGIHTLAYYSRDLAGNQETQRTADPVCRIDKNPPTITATPNKTAQYVQPPVSISLYAVDSLSGVSSRQYRRQGQTSWQTGDTIVIDGSGGDGVYTFEFRAVDNAGNASAPDSISLNVDGTYPSQAGGLVASPSDWVRTDGAFGVTWTNPYDFSGISGVYYQLDVDPTVTYAPTLVEENAITGLSDLSVLTDGAHTIYLWLQDGAGNSSEWSSVSLPDAFMLDRVAPTMAISVDGPLGDDPLYYGGSVEVTLAGNDALSGMASLSYRIDGGAWQDVPVSSSPSLAEHMFAYSEQGRHTIEFKGTDAAGNDSNTGSLVVRIDSVAPASPGDLTPSPDGWSSSNTFDICWTNPYDYSGLSQVFAKYGSPPSSASDYDQATSLTGNQHCLSDVTVTQEGETVVYLWLRDRAGNVDHTSAAQVSLFHDASQPTTSVTPDGTMGDNNYYVSSVALCLDSVDAVSGVFQTSYRLNGGATMQWQGQDIILDQEGDHEIEFWSVDLAGNQEQPHNTELIKIDLYAPTASVHAGSDYVAGSNASIGWRGSDTSDGSGVSNYSVRYRLGGCSPWQTWLTGTPNTSQTLTGMTANNFYYFGVEARDRAGHTSTWTADDAAPSVYVEGLGNSDFELQQFGAWDDDGQIDSRVVYAESHTGGYSYMGRLAPDYGDLQDCGDIQAVSVPVNGYASLSQLIQLPSVPCDQGLVLSFKYRIETFDTAIGIDSDDGQIKQFDPFLVHIRDVNGFELANTMPAGNFTDYVQWIKCVPYDSGWRTQVIDLSPWAGQRIRIDFRVWNYVDEGWPTWAFVDDIQLLPRDSRVVSVPLIKTTGVQSMSSLSSDQAQAAPLPWLHEGGRKPRWVPLGE